MDTLEKDEEKIEGLNGEIEDRKKIQMENFRTEK